MMMVCIDQESIWEEDEQFNIEVLEYMFSMHVTDSVRH